MTEKLYYKDAYLKEFVAGVVSSVPCDGGYDVILDKTAFFPEEGGQASDDGTIGLSNVIHVYEKDGVIHHITDANVTGDTAFCKLNFSKRLEKMQCHTAEHILCGIIYKLFGFDNVGFHLGEDVVTFDVSGTLTKADIERVEALANEAVFENLAVEAYFPDVDEIKSLSFRSKLDFKEGVRIVKIGDVDSCACCAPHVSRTGEIGLIKILDFMKHRGGMRLTMVAGRRALLEFNILQSNIKRISAILSEPPHTTADMLEKYVADSEGVALQLKQTRIKLAELYAEGFSFDGEYAVVNRPELSIDELRTFSNAARGRCRGILVALSGVDGCYKYVISSDTRDVGAMSREINTALSGKGGGRGNMIQGSFATTLKKIKGYFS